MIAVSGCCRLALLGGVAGPIRQHVMPPIPEVFNSERFIASQFTQARVADVIRQGLMI